MYKISRSHQWNPDRAKSLVSTNSFTIIQFATPNAVAICLTIGSRALHCSIFLSFLIMIFVIRSFMSVFKYYAWEKQ